MTSAPAAIDVAPLDVVTGLFGCLAAFLAVTGLYVLVLALLRELRA